MTEDQPLTKKIWKYENQFDFLYGEAVGTLIGMSIGMFLITYRRRATMDELYEIKEIVEFHAKEIRDVLEKHKKS